MSRILRKTEQTRTVLEALSEAGEATYGYEIVQATGLPSGTVYPILVRLKAAGLIIMFRGREREKQGPIRRWVCITKAGKQALEEW